MILSLAAATVLAFFTGWYFVRNWPGGDAIFVGLAGTAVVMTIIAYQAMPVAVEIAQLGNRSVLNRNDVRTATIEYRFRVGDQESVATANVRCAERQVVTRFYRDLGIYTPIVKRVATPIGGDFTEVIADGVEVTATPDETACTGLLLLDAGIAPVPSAALNPAGTSWPIYVMDRRQSPPTIVEFHLSDQPITVGDVVAFPPTILAVSEDGRVLEGEFRTDAEPNRSDPEPPAVAELKSAQYRGLEIHWDCWATRTDVCSAKDIAYLGDGPAPSRAAPASADEADAEPLCRELSARLTALPLGDLLATDPPGGDPLELIAASGDGFLELDRSTPVLDGRGSTAPDAGTTTLPYIDDRWPLHAFLEGLVTRSEPELAEFLVNPDPWPRPNGAARLWVWDRQFGSSASMHALQIGGVDPGQCVTFVFYSVGDDGVLHRIPLPARMTYAAVNVGNCADSRAPYVGSAAGVPVLLHSSIIRSRAEYQVALTAWTGTAWTPSCQIDIAYAAIDPVGAP